MVRHLPAVGALGLLLVACSPRGVSPRTVAHAPIGVETTSAVPLTSAVTESVAVPDAACALPVKCDAREAGSLFSITLERTPCFGRCPVYRVTLDARGEIAWHGRDFIDAPGAFTVPGDARKARELIELVLASCFFEMQDEYASVLTDAAWANTTVTIGNTTKTVRHHLGDTLPGATPPPGTCGAPATLTKIETAIDQVANTARWVGRGGAAH
jgi:hypothetical protein